jgi:selenoprotein W-related protein
MATALLDKYGTEINSLSMIPSGGGVFEVTRNGSLIYSKKKTGKFPEINEIISLIK